jgi:hypothetical protein
MSDDDRTATCWVFSEGQFEPHWSVATVVCGRTLLVVEAELAQLWVALNREPSSVVVIAEYDDVEEDRNTHGIIVGEWAGYPQSFFDKHTRLSEYEPEGTSRE